jgi:hypothetical protein
LQHYPFFTSHITTFAVRLAAIAGRHRNKRELNQRLTKPPMAIKLAFMACMQV